MKFSASWRPFPRHGFYLQVGYGYARLWGTFAFADMMEAAGNPALPDGATAAGSVAATSIVHLVEGELGWCHCAERGVLVRVALGVTAAFASSSTLTPSSKPVDPQAVDDMMGSVRVQIDRALVKLVSPVLSLGVGYRF